MCYGKTSHFENIHIYTMLLCITATKPRSDILFRVLLLRCMRWKKRAARATTIFFYIFIWNSQKSQRKEKIKLEKSERKKRGEYTHAVYCVCEAKKAISRKDLSFWVLFLPSLRSHSLHITFSAVVADLISFD